MGQQPAMPTFEKHFSVEEANALLPLARRVFAEIHQLQAQVRDAHQRIEGNGGTHSAEGVTAKAGRIGNLIMSLMTEGIQVKDVSRGLIDFPHLREGEEVLLCWQLADGDEIRYWHDLVKGFAGRQPL